MALTDPQAVSLNGTDSISLARTDLAKNKGSFISPDGNLELNISSTFSAKAGASTLVRIDQRKVVTDAVTHVAKSATASAWIVIRRPDNGFFTADELSALAKGLAAYVTASTFTRILVGEA